MDPDFQMVLLGLTCLVICLNLIVNMVIPGKIPLFMDSGSAERFAATENSRLLTWLNFGTAPLGGVLFAVTGNARVRRYAGFAVGLQVVQFILFASKAGILTIMFILLNAMFVAQQRQEAERFQKLRQVAVRASLALVCLIPFYLVAIGIGGGSGSTTGVIAMRLLGTFDQLVLVSQGDLLKHSRGLFQANILQYQLMPLLRCCLHGFFRIRVWANTLLRLQPASASRVLIPFRTRI